MDKEEKSKIKYRMRCLARKFCKRNGVYESFADSVGKLIEKAYFSAYLLCLHENKNKIAELKEFYKKEYFEIADRTADEKIKELEKYQTEVTVDDYSPYDENTWGMMHEEMFVPKELVRDLLKESYALSEHRKDNLTKAKEILQTVLDKWKKERWILQSEKEVKQIENLMEQAEQFLNSEVEK